MERRSHWEEDLREDLETQMTTMEVAAEAEVAEEDEVMLVMSQRRDSQPSTVTNTRTEDSSAT